MGVEDFSKLSNRQQIDLLAARMNEHGQALENGTLRDGQHQQILEQYRVNIYNLELKTDLLIKMMEEKGIMAKDEFAKRWPLYLKNEIGVTGPDGKMEGILKTSFYDGGVKS